MIRITDKCEYGSIFISVINQTFYIDKTGIFKDPDFEEWYRPLLVKDGREPQKIDRLYYSTESLFKIISNYTTNTKHIQYSIEKLLFKYM